MANVAPPFSIRAVPDGAVRACVLVTPPPCGALPPVTTRSHLVVECYCGPDDQSRPMGSYDVLETPAIYGLYISVRDVGAVVVKDGGAEGTSPITSGHVTWLMADGTERTETL